MQTDDVLRTYPEYKEGQDDKKAGNASRRLEYPLIAQGGAFLKKAYILGYNEG